MLLQKCVKQPNTYYLYFIIKISSPNPNKALYQSPLNSASSLSRPLLDNAQNMRLPSNNHYSRICSSSIRYLELSRFHISLDAIKNELMRGYSISFVCRATRYYYCKGCKTFIEIETRNKLGIAEM